MESAAQQPGEDEDEPEPFLQLGAAVAPPDAESDDEDQEVVPIAGANEPDVLTSRDDSAGSAQRADAEAALKAAAALAHPAAEAAKAAAEAMEDPAEAAEAAEAAMEEDRVRVEVPHDTLPVSSSSEPPLPQDLPPPLDTDPPEQAPRLRSVSQESPRPPQPTDATQPEEVSHLPRGTRVFLSGGSESVGAYNGHAGVVQAYHETAEAYTVQLDSSGPQDLTVLQVSRHNVTAEAEGSPLPPLSLALPVQDVQDTLQDSSIARDPTLQSVGRSSELDTLHSLHINPGSILGRVLLAYCSQVAKRPKRLLFLYILCAVVPLVVGILFRGFALETDFNAFIKADGSAMRDREAYQLAYEEKKDLTGGRRLEEVQPFLQVDEWIEEVEAEDAEGVRRLLEENYTTAPGRRLRTLFLRKELQLLYRAKNGNILDDKALQDIQAIEEGFRTLPGVRNLCYTRITSESKRFLCDPGISLVAMAFPTQSSSSQGRAFLEFTWDGMGRDLVPPAAVLAYMKTAAEYGDSSRTSRRYFPKTWTYPDVGDFQAESAMPDAARTKFSYHLTLGQNGDPVSQVNANIGKTKEEWNKLITTEMLPYFHKVQSEQVEFYYASTDIDSIEETRRPRRLPEIICAISVTALGMTAGALGGQRLWAMLRDRTEDWCQDAPTVTSLGLDAAHLGKCSHAFYCTHLRSEPSIDSGIAILSGLFWGPVALYASFGASYFASLTEEEELMELERLYRERGRGESFVLSSWRWCKWAYFVFDILVAMWLRYYLDLYLDIQAMKIFWDHGDTWFFVSNFGGIVLGLLWTAVEFYKILRDEPKDALPGWQVLVVGLLIPAAGLHVTYLALLSLMMGVKHRFLYISTLAESVLESAVSAFVQTYAVVFNSKRLVDEDKFDLYTSIALSFVSIGYAFSALDKYDGGELLVKVPGLCRGANAKWWCVFAFRIAEVTSRATSLALFQCVWRPWGIMTVMSADTVLVVSLAALSQMTRGSKYSRGANRLIRDNLVYALPSSICLMTPMLEKDSPMTLPPELYYSLRLAELGGMVALMGWSLQWDLDAAREIFQDDALIVSAFVLSTILMIVLGFFLRWFVAVRTLLEAPVEMWHMRPFNVTQQVLRNRILGVEAGFKSRAWQSEQRRIMAKIQRAPHRASHLQHAMLRGDLPDMSLAEWDARFLSAKVSYCLEQSLHSLASTFLETQKDVKAGGRVSKRFSRKRPEESNQGSIEAKSGSETRLGGRGQGPLRTGSLVHLRGPGGGLTTTEDHTVVMRWAGDTSDQKFVVEATEDVERFGFATENVLSGAVVRLRALTDATLVRIAALGDKDEESGKFESWNLVTGPDRGAGDPDCLFSLMLWHEEEYRNARRFALNVRPLNKGCLEVRSFRPSGELSSDFIEGGWRIAAINGRPATAEDVEAILAFAQTDMDDDVSEDGVSPGPSMVEPAESLRSRTQKFMPARTNTLASGAVKGNRYRVCFEKAYGNDMVVGVGEKVVLRVASVPGAGAAAGAVVGFGLKIGHGPSGLDTTGTRAVVVSESADPLPLIVEPADIGSRDDPPLYGWAAEEIRRRAEASQIRASLAEKCRVAVVVGFNSRANGVRGALQACTRELHLRMLRLLVSLVRGYRETEVHFDSHDEIMEELRFGSVTPDNSQPLTVQAVDAEDGIAAAAGVQPGDELVELEVDKNGNRDSLHRGTKEIVQVLGLRPQLAAAKSRLPIGPRFEAPSWAARGAGPAASPPMTLLFRSPERIPVDSGVQKVLVAEAVLVAQLLPTWEEISRPEEFSLEASKSATAARLLRHDEFFRLKCSLVTSLLQQGWELRYAGFAESAMMIHQNLDALTRETIRVRFPNLDDATKEGLLSEQLEVLTASWAAVPRAVKEQQPEQLRRLFRHDVELVAMHDAVDTAYKAWTEKTCDEKTIVEMPATLQRFVERLRPPYAVEALSSAWILRAWFTPEHQHEYELVQRVISRFTEIYENTEQYWIRKLDGAASRMEKTQEQLERALESADMRVALIPSDTAEEELLRIQKLLCPETLVLKADLSLGEGKDAQLIPAGLKLMRRGQVSDFFKPEVDNVELSRRLMELAAGADLRLLFGGDGYNEARKQAAEAIGELGAIIRVVKTAASAFPDVAAQCQELLDKHHKGELRAVTQENKLRIQIQEKEAEEMVRTANIRLMLAEGQKKAAEEKLREAEQERVLAESAKQESQQRADQWWENLQVMAKEKEMLETEKGRLESEKLQWTQVQSLMELEKSELQGDIQKAKEERKRLEHAAEKWHHTLQTVKAQAEEKEAHLKEIQAILQKQQEEAAAKSSAAEEPSQFTVTQLMSVLSKAFSADPGPAAPPSAVASAPAAPTSPVSPSPVSPVRVSAPEVEDASRAPPSSTMKMLTRLYSTYSAAPGPTVQGAAYAAKRGATARELSAD